MAKKLLILDNDLGFLLWLSAALAAAGFEPIPALSVNEANQMLRELRTPISLLVLNPAVPGAGEFTKKLRQNQQDLPVLALLPPTGDLDTNVRGVDGLRRKPQIVNDRTKADWVKTIREVILNFRRFGDSGTGMAG